MGRGKVIDDGLVRRLVMSQFPHWGNLPIEPVQVGGWDNRSFRLGESMVVRLPSSAEYEAQVAKEHQWLPKLAPLLPQPIPSPLALGEPAEGYPWKWSIYRWLEGDTASTERIADLRDFASSVAKFLDALQPIDSSGGPAPGRHNFYRGGPLATYDSDARHAIAALEGSIDVGAAMKGWEVALATTWQHSPLWIHGDCDAGKLL